MIRDKCIMACERQVLISTRKCDLLKKSTLRDGMRDDKRKYAYNVTEPFSLKPWWDTELPESAPSIGLSYTTGVIKYN